MQVNLSTILCIAGAKHSEVPRLALFDNVNDWLTARSFHFQHCQSLSYLKLNGLNIHTIATLFQNSTKIICSAPEVVKQFFVVAY